MSIRVTCPSCLKKFQVSDQFAGRKGPCPNCKKEITIPDPKKDKVVIESVEDTFPKDSTGKSILKPISREQTQITPVQIGIIITAVITYFAVALAIRFTVNVDAENPLDYPMSVLIFGAIAIGPPMAFAGYFFLKEEEMGSFLGKELYLRSSLCGLFFALTWITPEIIHYAFGEYSTLALVIAVVTMFGFGGLIASVSFHLQILMGQILFGLYFGVCILMRIIVKAQALPLEPS
ncbi:MAG: hypothetical protein VX438_13370 [Planctomycetota bacterium]|nr:hypothetical protein [Planctomycetota bacterium]